MEIRSYKSKGWKEELRKLPKLQELKKSLHEFSHKDFTNSSIEEIEKEFYKSGYLLPLTWDTFTAEFASQMPIYRVRDNVNVDKEDITQISTYANPPTAFCSENGRANLKYRSVFYASYCGIKTFRKCRPIFHQMAS